MAIALNHVFSFVEEGFPRKRILFAEKLKVGQTRDHAGQGTSAQFVYFPKDYLEFIWLRSIGESQFNQLKLNRRAAWRESGFSPFGIGLSGKVPLEHRDLFEEYLPPYSESLRIMIYRKCEEVPSLPLIFCRS